MEPNTINSIVNNLSDRLCGATEVVGVVAEKTGEIFQSMIQETSNHGFANIMLGFGIIFLSIICFCITISNYRTLKDKNVPCNEKDDSVVAIIFMGIATACFILTGLIIVGTNLDSWIAPTKTIAQEALKAIQG